MDEFLDDIHHDSPYLLLGHSNGSITLSKGLCSMMKLENEDMVEFTQDEHDQSAFYIAKSDNGLVCKDRGYSGLTTYSRLVTREIAKHYKPHRRLGMLMLAIGEAVDDGKVRVILEHKGAIDNGFGTRITKEAREAKIAID